MNENQNENKKELENHPTWGSWASDESASASETPVAESVNTAPAEGETQVAPEETGTETKADTLEASSADTAEHTVAETPAPQPAVEPAEKQTVFTGTPGQQASVGTPPAGGAPFVGTPIQPPPVGTPPYTGAPVQPPHMGGAPYTGAPIQPPPPPTAYRWTYADQRSHDAARDKKHRSKGLLLYALVMTGVFALSFGLLLGTMLMKGGDLPTVQFAEPVTDENGEIIYGNDYADAVNIEKTKHSVVLIEVTTPNGGGSGTGIILSEDGYIATNHHVIEDGTSIRVKFYDGTYASATLRGSSAVDDLAVIKVERSGLPAATFAKSSDCFVGQTVYAIGNPSGADMAWTTTKGCISYVDRELKIYHDDGTLEKKLKMIQTDAMVNPGNSGGPLVNVRGEVVGIVSMKLADGYEGIGFAIPSDGAAEILNAIIKDGNADNVNSNVSYDRPVIGIVGVYMEGGRHYVFEEDRIVEVSESYAQENPDEVISPGASGIYVRSLTEGTDAAVKLKAGDIITAINGVEATDMNVLMNEINEHYAGDDVTVTYYRNGLYTDVTITLSAAKG